MRNTLVVGFVDANGNGNINVGEVQPLAEWNGGKRNRELLRLSYGNKLSAILRMILALFRITQIHKD